MGSSSVSWFLTLVLCWGLPSPHTALSHTAAVYYVTPHTPNPDCPRGEPCLTIDEYAQGNHFDGDDNINLLFLNGEHSLKAQDFTIDNRTSFNMFPYQDQKTEVLIQILSENSVIIQNIHVVEISGLVFISSPHSAEHDDTPACLSIMNTRGLLSISSTSMKFCQLSLQKELDAIITELTASNSHVNLGLGQNNHSVVIRNSEFLFSTLNISDSPASQLFNGGTITSTMRLESSSMSNSLVTVKLQTGLSCELSIVNALITSQDNSTSETGIKIEAPSTVVINALIKNCSIIGNSQGIRVVADGKTRVQLNVDQCHIASNGCVTNKGTHQSGGGIVVLQSSNSVSIVSITSSTLSGNKPSQINILEHSGNSSVTVFNSTIRDSHIADSPDTYGAGANFTTDNSGSCYSVFINFTQNTFESNVYGVYLDGVICRYEMHFIGNNVSSNTPRVYPNTVGLYVNMDGYSAGKEVVNIAHSHFALGNGTAIYIAITAQITITETVIEQNENGVLVAVPHISNIDTALIHIKDSVFQENSAVSLGVANLQTGVSKSTDIILYNVTFFNNTNLNAGIVQVDERVSLSIEDSCKFRRNRGSALKAFNTSVTLSGEVIFRDNVAFQGGAMSLSFSMLNFQSENKSNTNIIFVNNTARNVGGGIYVDRSQNVDSSITGSVCFYEEIQGVSWNEIKHLIVNVTLLFTNNSAVNGGVDIYGATPNSDCTIKFGENAQYSSTKIQQYIFKTSSEVSSVSSEPKRVCLYDSFSQLMCPNLTYIFYNTTRYPGEVFPIHLAVVGLNFGPVTGPVFANLLPLGNNSVSSLGSGQNVRQFRLDSTKLSFEFSVNSINPKETIGLAVNTTRTTSPANPEQVSESIRRFDQSFHEIPVSLLSTIVYIDVTLYNHCPFGFSLTERGACECATALQHLWLNNCTINDSTPYITRSGNEWIQRVGSPNRILISKYCPFNYCEQNVTSIRLNSHTDSDKQCAFNRSKTLCGACASNYSLAIGSSRCLQCSDNYHTLLLTAFAAGGILLVLFIKVLDMTVATGTVNGLVFYANIIWANQSTLFPPQTQTSPLLHFLKIFIAWLNLDLGIETCFIRYLDGYWKTWLQFAFPAYIWLIAGLIILVSHYSIKATKILGNNSVSVLATLFLLSYAKLLRTIIIALEFTTLVEYPNGQKTVWSFDGNIEYLGVKHGILFFVAVAILVVLWLPYTLVLLLIQCLRRYSHYCVLRWVNKLMPFFDSYLGPLKAKHHYWIGVGLLTRLALLLTSAVTLTTVPFIPALLIAITAPYLCFLVSIVYKQWLLSVLECSFLVNMAIFSSGALYVEVIGGSKDSLACSSLGIAFILFLVIIGYHVGQRLLSWYSRKNPRNGYKDIDNIPTVPERPTQWQSTTYQEVSVPGLRESLLN